MPLKFQRFILPLKIKFAANINCRHPNTPFKCFRISLPYRSVYSPIYYLYLLLNNIYEKLRHLIRYYTCKFYNMKKIILLFALFISSAMYKAADAQVNVRINIGSQPVWGPVGYDYVDYYYFPDIDVYYSVPLRQFIYFTGRNWMYAYSLPGMYRNFDPFRSYKVVINEPDPFYRNNYYRTKYMGYRGQYQSQPIIYNSRDTKYYVIENHPEHQKWIEYNKRQNIYNTDRNYSNNRNYNADRKFAYKDNNGRLNNDRRSNDNRRYDFGRRN
jgi:hypothetical protein